MNNRNWHMIVVVIISLVTALILYVRIQREIDKILPLNLRNTMDSKFAVEFYVFDSRVPKSVRSKYFLACALVSLSLLFLSIEFAIGANWVAAGVTLLMSLIVGISTWRQYVRQKL